jgi:undecaprenyl-diphosphatase
MQRILNVTGQEVALTVVLHLGTVLSLIIFFFKDILQVMRSIKSLALIAVVTVFTGIIGISGKDFFERLFTAPKFVAFALILTGIILFLTKKFMNGKRDSVNIKDAGILGITQGIAIIPGISRSGITVSTLLFRGIDRKISFRFSFLASIPAVFGAAIMEAKDIGLALKGDFRNFAVGFTASLLTGILSLWILKIILHKSKLYYFGYYCIGVAIITLLFIK